jgi:exosortase family protein
MLTAVYAFCLLVWIYLLTVLKRAKLPFFYFCAGSVGMFLFLMLGASETLTVPLTRAVCAAVGIIGQLTHIFGSYAQYSMLYISAGGSHLTLTVDFECSGVIEMMAYVSLLCFFPVFRIFEKIFLSVMGIVWIFVANVIRVFSICLMVSAFGGSAFYLAHSVVSRLIFYGLSILLYYYTFTRSQISRQRVGGFNYGDDSNLSV